VTDPTPMANDPWLREYILQGNTVIVWFLLLVVVLQLASAGLSLVAIVLSVRRRRQ